MPPKLARSTSRRNRLHIAPRWQRYVERGRLLRVARRALAHTGVPGVVIIAIGSDAQIRSLNREFHATDAPTDVLSFPASAPGYLGDIVISYETARANARTAGWRTMDELELLIVHGILHLAGDDDRTQAERAAMWARQAEILGREIPPL